MKKLRITKSEIGRGRLYFTAGYIGTDYFCGKKDFILSRVVLPKDAQAKVEEGEEFSMRQGVYDEEVPDIQWLVEQRWRSPAIVENMLEDTELLRRNIIYGEEYPPMILFKHPAGWFTPISFKYAPLLKGLELFQPSDVERPISGYLEDKFVLTIMPVWADPHKPTRELLKAALEGLMAEVVA